MSSPADEKPYLNTPEAARLVKLSNRTLEKHRYQGTGPMFSKVGGRVIYAREDLYAWIAERRRCKQEPRRTSPRKGSRRNGGSDK